MSRSELIVEQKRNAELMVADALNHFIKVTGSHIRTIDFDVDKREVAQTFRVTLNLDEGD